MDKYWDIFKALFSIGAVGTGLKFLIDRIWSTDIEFDLENNYGRAFRELFNYVLFTSYVLFIGALLFSYMLGDFFGNKKIDVITGAHYSFNQIELDKLLKLRYRKLLYLLCISLASLIFGIYYALRNFWYYNYRRRSYVLLGGETYFVKKRILKNKVLLTNDKGKYRIINLENLEKTDFIKETSSERNNKRYISYYNNFQKRKKWSEKDLLSKIFFILLLLFVGVIIYLFDVIQEHNIFYRVGLGVMFSVVALYNYYQYKCGKKKLEHMQTVHFTLSFLPKKE
ncbi:hypothetical protein WOA_01241 [Enterococcus faecalis EnGen0356]|uniref:hypothetical protein n=1 Tax=Enterococcus faecalis TaxID=1351 RepID=UPI00032E980F|nr:hypothetical protein [Enterococcus faecalis]EOJ79849.1 hypothetical protein WOA_01241 [Enterococcus faecalis EnGen0356]